MENIKQFMQEGIGSYVSRAMQVFGIDVNTKRQIPLIFDGLKPVYRRAIYAMLNRGNEFTKTATIVGTMIGTTHPHGSASCEDPISNLVRWGIAEGQGNHGLKTLIGDDIERSASRYTEVKLATNYQKIFNDLINYVEFSPAELPGFNEPNYLPTPVPLCLTFGLLGIGNGVNSRIPVFTVRSMMDALLNDDPNYLESAFGLDLIKDESELDLLWNKGIGKLTYAYKSFTRRSSSGPGVYIEGEAELFKPNLHQIQKYVKMGRLYIIDETDGTGSRLFIGKNYNVRGLPYEYILEMAKKASKLTRTYRLTVTDGNKVFLIPLKDWLKITYENYLEVIERYRIDKLNKSRFDYQVQFNIPEVAKLIFENPNISNSEISSKLNLSTDIVSAILQKSINTLRRVDGGDKKLKNYQDKINYFEKLNPAKFVEDIIHEF